MAGTPRPQNTYISNVFNPGIDKNIPKGFVDVVFDRATGKMVGYMQNGSFYGPGVDAAAYDKQQEENPTFAGAGLGDRPRGPVGIQGEIQSKGLAVTTAPGGGTYVSDPDGNEVFLYLSTKADAKGNYEVLVDSNYDSIRNKILTEANSVPGGIDNLFNSMFRAGLISKATYDKKDISDQDFNKNLAFAVRNYSIKQVDNLTIGGQKQVGGFFDFLGTGGGLGTPSSKTSYDAVVTTRQDAAEDVNRFFMQNFGYGATKADEDAYYLALRELEKENIVKTTNKYDADGNLVGTTKTGELVSDLDKALLLGKIAGKAIKGGNLDKILKGGGKAADDVNEILSYASNYGIELTQQEAIDYVGVQLRKGLNIDSSKNKILQLAKVKYSNLSDVLSDTISVKDISSSKIQRLSRLTGMDVNSIGANNPLIQQALANNGQKGVMNDADFDKLVKTNPETRALWLQQPGTKDEAASYALNILQMFGLVA